MEATTPDGKHRWNRVVAARAGEQAVADVRLADKVMAEIEARRKADAEATDRESREEGERVLEEGRRAEEEKNRREKEARERAARREAAREAALKARYKKFADSVKELLSLRWTESEAREWQAAFGTEPGPSQVTLAACPRGSNVERPRDSCPPVATVLLSTDPWLLLLEESTTSGNVQLRAGEIITFESPRPAASGMASWVSVFRESAGYGKRRLFYSSARSYEIDGRVRKTVSLESCKYDCPGLLTKAAYMGDVWDCSWDCWKKKKTFQSGQTFQARIEFASPWSLGSDKDHPRMYFLPTSRVKQKQRFFDARPLAADNFSPLVLVTLDEIEKLASDAGLTLARSTLPPR